jgi:hypothetical protein
VLLGIASPRHESAAVAAKGVLTAPPLWLANPSAAAKFPLLRLRVRKAPLRLAGGIEADRRLEDRLPTVSAAEALRRLREAGGRVIPTGIPELDARLTGHALSSYGRGGIVRGQLTEVFGPPGCGKTAFGYYACSNIAGGDSHRFSVFNLSLRRYVKAALWFGLVST